MKIYSKFKDYYDVGLQYGIDPNCKYVRTTETFYYGDEKWDIINKMLRTHYQFNWYEKLLYQHFILFCGKIYFCAEFYDGPPMKHTSIFVYNYESLLKYCEVYNNTTLLNRVTKERHSKWSISAKDSFSQFPSNKKDKLIQFSIDIGSPIMMYTADKYIDKSTAILNPCLKDVGFFKAVDPVTAFQELSMFISGVMGGQAPPMVQISDKVRLEKHGFDSVKSFRNMK